MAAKVLARMVNVPHNGKGVDAMSWIAWRFT